MSLAPPTRGALRLVPAACLVLPALVLMLVGAWRYFDLWREAEMRLDRSVRVAAEHAGRVLDSTEALLARVRDAASAAGGSEQVLRHESFLHGQLAAMARDKPQLQGIAIFGTDGLPKVASRVFPAPQVWVGDRDYFAWHAQGRGGIYVSQPLVTRTTGEPFFDVSVRLGGPDGGFGGVISVSLLARYFSEFQTDLVSSEPAMAMILMRESGEIFARTPSPYDSMTRLPPDSLVMRQIAAGATAGDVRAIAGTDGVRRAAAFRKVGDYPIYVAAGVGARAVHYRWLTEMGILALFGFPLALAVFLAVRRALVQSTAAIESARQLADSVRAQQEMQAALLQAQKLEALGRVSGGVAHDFNNALMVISNSLALLRLKNPGISGSYLASMDRALKAATQLTRQLLAFSRRQALVAEQVVLQEQLPSMSELLKPVLGGRIDLRIEVAPQTAPIRVDPAEFELALINLAINARDAMPQEGSFTLRAANAAEDESVQLDGPLVRVEAIDTGSGIAPEVLDKVFDPFFTTKPPGQGTGLGLSQVYGLCQRAGGMAQLVSRPGEGATVRMLFPADVGAPRAQDSGGGEISKGAGCSVLLVEDNPDVASALLPLLEAAGCRVFHHDRAAAALAWLESQHRLPDAVLTDVVMPGEMDGLALARVVRERWPGLKVVVMTGYTENLDEIAAAGLMVLPKPCTLDVLMRALGQGGSAPRC